MTAELIWPTLLLLLGLGCLIAEVFLPSGGLLGVLAAACLALSLYLAHAVADAMVYRWLAVEAVAIPATWAGTMYGLPRTKLGRRVYLEPPSTADLELRPSLHAVGSSGRAVTPLRPSGMIDVAGRRVEALAESGLIEVGATVTVVAIRSGRVVVRVVGP